MATQTQYRYYTSRAFAGADLKRTVRPVRETVPVFEMRPNEKGEPQRVQVGTRIAVHTMSARKRHEMWPARVRGHSTRPGSKRGGR